MWRVNSLPTCLNEVVFNGGLIADRIVFLQAYKPLNSMSKQRFKRKGIILPVVGFTEKEVQSIDDLPGEVWASFEVKGLEYYISSLGRLRSPKRELEYSLHGRMVVRTTPPKILKAVQDSYGYAMVTIKHKVFHLHRLVAKCFLGDSNLEVNHLNGNKLDNRVSNLEYCTHFQNMQHAFKSGLIDIRTVNKKRSEKAALLNRKVAIEQEEEIYNLVSCGKTYKELSLIFNVHPTSIGRIYRKIKALHKNNNV